MYFNPSNVLNMFTSVRIYISLYCVVLLFRQIQCYTIAQSANRLYHELMKKKGYTKNVRPVKQDSDAVTVKLGLKILQLMDIDEKNQIMQTNAIVNQEWNDTSFVWNPQDYNGVTMLYVPVDEIWHPDLVLYNNADGNYEMTPNTKATIFHNGIVKWLPPVSFKSSCDMDVLYFPFDEQHCHIKLGSWTYNSNEVKFKHILEYKDGISIDINSDHFKGIDLTRYFQSVEWDLMSATAVKNHTHYAGSELPFEEWSFSLKLKRKFLFYTVNLIIPLASHAFLTIMVFYLPSDSKEKISLSINILLSMTVFFLLLAEIIPSTSLVVPLLGKYLIFTLLLVVMSIFTTVVTYNVHFRSSATHVMPDWIRKVFLYWFPKLLHMRRPKIENSHDIELKHIKLKLCSCFGESKENRPNRDLHSAHQFNHRAGNNYQFGSKRTHTQQELLRLSRELDEEGSMVGDSNFSPEVQKAIEGAMYIANHLKEEDEYNRTKEDWKYVALVIDRIFLWIYTVVCIVATLGIICQAPLLYDARTPIKGITEDTTEALCQCQNDLPKEELLNRTVAGEFC